MECVQCVRILPIHAPSPPQVPHVQSERLDAILRRLGFTPDVEDRLRTLELALACVAQDLANEIGLRLDLAQRVQELEKRLGAITSRRSGPWE